MSEIKNLDFVKIEINPLLEKLREKPIVENAENNIFKSHDSNKIFYRTWKPIKGIKKILMVAHGMGGHGEFFVLLADRLVDHGIMVVVPDYRNHGYSEGKKGDLKKFKYLLKDFSYFINFIKEKFPNIPIFLFGESMGGTVSINFAKNYGGDFSNLSGLILFAPGIKRDISKKFWIGISLLAIPLLFLRIFFPSKRIISARGREEEGIRNPIHQQYDKTDPLHLERLSIRYILQLFKYMRKTTKISPLISIPTIIFQGKEDKGISPESVERFYNKLASRDKKLVLIEEGYHALLTDPCFQDKWSILIDWLKNH